MNWDLIVVGAGCAGLASATRAAEAGLRVLVLERRPLLGGRASSFKDTPSGETVDNGQHLFLGCYADTLTYLDRVRARKNLSFSGAFSTPMFGLNGERSELRARSLPAPLHLAGAILGYKALSFRERVGALRVAQACRRPNSKLKEVSVRTWLDSLGQSRRARERLWDPLVLATLNASPDEVPADLLAVVLRDGFLGSRQASAVGLSRVGLSELLGDPAKVFIEAHGGEVRLRTTTKSIRFEGDQAVGVELVDGTLERGRAVISAVPPRAARLLLKDGAPSRLTQAVEASVDLQPSPILSVHVWLNRVPFDAPFVGFWGGDAHWLFRKAAFSQDASVRHLSLVISAAPKTLLDLSKEDLTRKAETELQGYFQDPGLKVERALPVREMEATWVPPLGNTSSRPPTKTTVPNFLLAGDWTDTGLPGTIEGAVRSGHKAAEALLQLTRGSAFATVPPENPMNELEVTELISSLRGTLSIDGSEIVVTDLKRFREKQLDTLVREAVFHPDAETQKFLFWLIRAIAQSAGVVPASIQALYEAKGHGKMAKQTVPAFNLRGMTYDVARSLIRASLKNSCGALIFEIARSEIGYTQQRPAEYAAVITAAALREGFAGPLFLQGDHFQFNAKRFAQDPVKETEELKALTREAIEAGFFNIDIDASTLVDLRHATLEDQQKLNCEKTVEMIQFIRSIEPKGVTVSIGGEIGEVGGKNSTLDELRVFLDGVIRGLEASGGKMKGLSKVSVQSGTTHGGVPLAEGGVAPVNISFNVLKQLSELAKSAYKLAGVVQHGASTLPEAEFEKFPHAETAEIHLATAFQNWIFDSPNFPKDLDAEIATYLKKECADDRKSGETDTQFLYKTRKKAFGPFKRKLWDLPQATRDAITKELHGRFDLILRKLDVINTVEFVSETVNPVKVLAPVQEKFGALLKK